jgi:hypothetical protein
MTTGPVSAAIQEKISSNGWQLSKILINQGLSLVTGVEETSVDVAALQDQDHQHQDTGQGLEDDHEGKAVQVIRDLKEQDFEVRKLSTNASWHQSKIESMIKAFKNASMPASYLAPAL